MPLDPNIILGGRTIDTAAPINNLAAQLQSKALAGSQLATNRLALQSGQNTYATQVLAAAAGSGDQNVWTATKQKLQQNGIDTSAIPDDITSGQQWATAARLAQSPYGALVNAAGKIDANSAAAAGINGTTITPNAAMSKVLPGLTGPVQTGMAAPGGISPQNPGMQLNNDPAAINKAMGASQEQTAQDPTQTQQAIQSHYQALSPADQANVQNVSKAAAGLMPFLQNNDTQGAMQYLTHLKQAGIDPQAVDGAMQMLQSGQIDQLKQSVAGIAAYGQTVGQGSPAQGQGFTPPPQNPNENPAAYKNRVEIAKQAWDSDPANIQAQTQAKNLGEETAKQTGASAQNEQMYNKLFQNLEALKKLNNGTPDSFMMDPEWKAGLGKRVGLTGDATALAQWNQINHAQILNSLAQLVSQSATGSSIRSNKTIVQLLSTGSGIPADMPKNARLDMINNLEAELKNTMTGSENVKNVLTGQPQTPMEAIPANAGAQNNPPALTEGATATNPQTGQKIIFKGGQWQAQ